MAEVLTVSETGRELHVSDKTVRKWADTGKLPVMRTSGGQRIFTRESVDRLREARERSEAE